MAMLAAETASSVVGTTFVRSLVAHVQQGIVAATSHRQSTSNITVTGEVIISKDTTIFGEFQSYPLCTESAS